MSRSQRTVYLGTAIAMVLMLLVAAAKDGSIEARIVCGVMACLIVYYNLRVWPRLR